MSAPLDFAIMASIDRLEDTGTISQFHAYRSSKHRTKHGHVAALPRSGELLLWYSQTTTLHYSYRGWSLQRESFLPLSLNLISWTYRYVICSKTSFVFPNRRWRCFLASAGLLGTLSHWPVFLSTMLPCSERVVATT